MFLLQTNGIYDLKEVFEKTNYLPVLLNLAPIFIFTLLAFFLTNNFIVSSSIATITVVLLSFLNRYKIIMRQDPLLPWDFTLVHEVVAILKTVNVKLFPGIFALPVVIIIITIVLNSFFKTPKMNAFIRVGTSALLIAVFFALNNKVYSDAKLFDVLYVKGNIYNQTESFNSKGFLYSFIYANNMNKLKKFDGYTISAASRLESSQSENRADAANNKINVFIIMSEAFSDIADNEALDFSGYTDPLANYKRVKENSVNGYLVAPGLGGGTADTEFDVLTAINTRNFRGVPFTYRIVNRPLESIASSLNSIGYENIAIHPGYEWFYNRVNVYRHFGFSNFIDIKNYPDDNMYKGMYVKEVHTFDTIIEEFENHLDKSPGTPFFDFCVTIQNHGPYKDKYLSETNFKTNLPLEEYDINELSNYFEGLADVDAQIGRLYDYIQDSKEPIAVLYFGDHLPAFSQAVYENLIDSNKNDLTELTNRYSTPYLIFQNNACKEIADFSSQKTFDKVSSNYLGAYFLKLLGYEGLSPYFKYSLEMLSKYPVVLEKQYFDSQYNLHETSGNKELEGYSYWQYYKIFDKPEEKQ
jgi:phosphoglycerol transferase MdoB-like AlkP superfamily enzyme